MKYLFILLSLVFTDNQCSESKINQDALSLEYSANSRGLYKNIKVNKKDISVINKRDALAFTKGCSEGDWKKLLNALKPVEVDHIPNLKAPSNNRLFDGAAIARLKINYEGTLYETKPFDHGNPPEEIAALVKEILTLAKNIE